MTTVPIDDAPPIARPEAVALAEAESARMAALLRSLGPDDWARPTDCPASNMRAMAGHVLGMAETFTGMCRLVSSMRAGGKTARDAGVAFVDGLTAGCCARCP